jgi:poly(A) polymerase
MPPVVIPRSEHSLSRRDVDPDALKVLYRLKEGGFKAYLVGGGVRDLLLGRRPKDFDVGTDAHPAQVKRLFRNCFIVGRRFRLAHVRFGTKVIEVATFRRQTDSDEPVADGDSAAHEPAGDAGYRDEVSHADGHDPHRVHRDNTFGTDEEDAFRRDFTINALFYDIATFSIIDYTGGLDDLRAGLIRSIGDPDERFREDPVRMQRAVAFAARLGFRIDPPVLDAIDDAGPLLATAAPARLMDEYYKILRSGAAARTAALLRDTGLLAALSDVLHAGAGTEAFQSSLERLDAVRQRHESAPDWLTNPILLGSLIVPLGFSHMGWPDWLQDPETPGLHLGVLPVARRDVERLHQVLMLQRRLREPGRSGPARRSFMLRSAFIDALTWLDVHGDAPDAVAYWREQLAATPEAVPDTRPRRRRRSGRRRRP